MASAADLKLDWCDYKSAKWACEHYHYSRAIPAGKLVKIGVWEDGEFIGAVIFGRGANNNMSKRYKLSQSEVAELVRVALKQHKTPVTKILKVAISMLRKSNKGLKLIVSYADKTNQGHSGIIYKAGNWVYDGLSVSGKDAHYKLNGKLIHGRSMRAKYGHKRNFPVGVEEVTGLEKHRFIYPLNKDWYNDYVCASS